MTDNLAKQESSQRKNSKKKIMNRTKYLAGKLGIVLGGALLAYTSSGQPSVSVGISVPLPSVEIRAESDFYEPLAPHGEWVVVGSYGRCWRPAHVARDWRPYCDGRWERTDAGWYWVSTEPWAWATYHYGRWDFTDQYGWYWVPQTQWAPAWVSWHEGGGYVGWAPLQPSVSISVNGYVGFNQSRISPRAFVFVEQRRFLEPIRPTTVVVNNTTIINKTVTITNTKIVNNTVINEGPATTVIEKASGRKVQPVQVRELRQKEEAPIAAKQRTSTSTTEKKVQPPAAARTEAEPRDKKAAAAPATTQVEKPAVTPRTPTPPTPTGRVRENENAKPVPSQEAPRPGATAPAPKNYEPPGEKRQPVPASPDFKPDARPETSHPAANNQSTDQKANKQIQKQQPPARQSDNKAPQRVQEKPAPREQNAPNPPGKDQENKP